MSTSHVPTREPIFGPCWICGGLSTTQSTMGWECPTCTARLFAPLSPADAAVYAAFKVRADADRARKLALAQPPQPEVT